MFFAVGIENAHIPEMGVDQLAWTRHREHWREDLRLVKELGVSHIRYGLPWAEVNPGPGRFEWGWTDEVVEELEGLGIEPIWDLVHFSTPTFLPLGVLDPGFVEAMEAYAGAFAWRYKGRVNKITPLNEPYISTYFRAGWGIWPPHLKGRKGFVRMLYPVVEGTRAAIRAIRQENPGAEIWLNDGADYFHPATPELAEYARERTEERYAALDLLLGHKGSHGWLRAAGYPEAGLQAEPVEIEVIGLDYYPETEHLLYQDSLGRKRIRGARQRRLGLRHTLQDYYQRYKRPLFIAETSATKKPLEWLAYSMNQIGQATAEGIPVLGYVWWPFFDFYDWNSLLRKLKGHRCPVGLYALLPTASDREATATLEAYRQIIQENR